MHRFTAIETEIVRKWQEGRPDDNGQTPERAVSDGQGNPCRHCLRQIPEGQEMLILGHRPFETLQPYAETGPVFVCATPCTRAEPEETPEILQSSPDYLIKGYSADERIVYGTGEITPTSRITDKIQSVFADPKVAFIHIRSARNNCYQLRIDRS
ncbi:DUF1203 domain-containing protein [uncultured Roseobacter sp.]|uniref:DUF1203 domain-containing protein n=1 Tax=uncultured Roseobacter sp. TaxID=114847 RepID=UPI0026380566|nr:DUF1203 domain-containing protein [uncultured Roseobacter sp.]